MKTQLSDPVALRMPLEMLNELDAVAEILDRKRSWIIVRALRSYLAGEGRYLRELAAADRESGTSVDMQDLVDELAADLTLVGKSRP